MRSFSTTLQNALLNRAIVFRDFLWLIPRDMSTGNPAPYGFWSGAGNISAQVINPLSGSAVSRNFEGAGVMISISDIPAVSNLTVQNVSIRISQLNDDAQEVVRGYDLKQGRVEIYSGYFDPESRALLEPAFCRFQGFVDFVDVHTPKEGDDGYIDLTCTSHTSELTRTNPDTRSHDSQQLRAPGDAFFKDAVAVSDWNIFWGQKQG
ncbi:MAG: hypothetical protein WBH00_13290 [Xanthobacteraceae bacterium]